jgi:hypothetical protein
MKRKQKRASRKRRAAPKGLDQKRMGRSPATEPPKAKRRDDL